MILKVLLTPVRKATVAAWATCAVGSCVLAATLTPIPLALATEGQEGPGGITLRSSMTAYTGYEGHLLESGFDNQLNPGNLVLSLPTSTWIEDVRPVVKVESDAGGLNIMGVAKPRLLVHGNWVSQLPTPGASSSTSYNQTVDFEWIEAYVKWQVNENLTVSAGAQNTQWGPGELFSPSNEIFPFFFQNNMPLFYLRGRPMFEANWTPSRNTSLALISQYDKNGDPVFQSGKPFAKKTLLKGETNFTIGDNNNTHTAALIVGTDENRANWLGQYANFTVSDSVSLYLDASENFRKDAYYPNAAVVPGSVVLTGPETSDTGVFPRILVGGRYTFPKGAELRVEYLYNGVGWSRDQYVQALSSLNDPLYGTQNIARFAASGLDFRSQHYAYLSLRIGDLGHKDKTTVFLRYLHNLTDQSGSATASVEWTPADRWGVVAAVTAERGPANKELTQLEDAETQAALKLDF